jgi:dolichol-phosphate mannosyltransferase
MRRPAIFLAPLLDILAFCAFVGAGLSLRASNAYAFAIGFALSTLLRWPALRAAGDSAAVWRILLRSAVVGLMALTLRAGLLALLTQRWGWAPQIGIVFAVALGLVVTAPRWRNAAAALIAYSFVLRLVYAGSVELLPEETYYWNYSRHLDFGYLDHPPMVAWLIRLATAVREHRVWRARRRAALRDGHLDFCL